MLKQKTMKHHFLPKLTPFILLAALFGCTQTTFISTPGLFTDNMVLQQNSRVKIWGNADPGVNVDISGTWGSSVRCKANKTGMWITELTTIKAGGPYELTIVSGSIQKTFRNVLLGEVWICSGQSNMEMPLISNWAHVNNAEQEATQANYPEIRLFTVQRAIAFNPIDSIVSEGWIPCDSNSVKNFSATAYFFGRTLYQEFKVPIGLIHSSWGGTVAEAWTSSHSLLNLNDFAALTREISQLNISPDSLERKYEADTRQMYHEIAFADIGIQDSDTLFASETLDDHDWFSIDLPKMWEETKLGNYDGATWFRKTINLSPEMAKSQLTLNYGAPDDYDEAWVNGVKVGENNVWNVLRSYRIPKGVAKPGKNVIAIRIFDNGGAGGFMGKPDDFKLTSETGKRLPVAKGWLAKKGFDFRDIKTHPVSPTEPNQPTVLFNGMIHPLIPYTIKGVIWYQGESNAGRAYQYRTLFKTLITDWREQWNQGDFPFLFVQLSNYLARNTEPVEDTWAELREAQTLTLELPNTGMAVTIDIGDALNIHPGNKQEVGRRLAINALAKVYNKNIPFSGPIYSGYKITGNTVELSFTQVYNGLQVAGNGLLNGFSIAGSDSVFHWANAVIQNNQVLVSSPNVQPPLAVRYAWSGNPECNLINSADLPASPFRTDKWKGITE